MHYTERAMSSSLWVNYFSYEQIGFIKWSVLILYALAMITIYLLDMIEFPGFYDNSGSMVNFNSWFNNNYYRLNRITDYLWLPLNFSSTIITFLAVKKILKITSTLSLTNDNVKVNKKTLIAHVSVLTL